MVALSQVEIPGFREAVKRERELRDRAFLGGNEIVCGVVVRQLSLRTLLFLEHSENGFVIPYKYDSDVEVVAHALQVLWLSRPEWKAPEVRRYSFLREMRDAYRYHRFQRAVLRAVDPSEIVKEVSAWVSDSFVDCPSAQTSTGYRPSYVSHPANIVDLFGAAGLRFTYDEIMDMPLKRMWQHWRLAAHRVYDLKLTNPSDELAVAFLARKGTQ